MVIFFFLLVGPNLIFAHNCGSGQCSCGEKLKIEAPSSLWIGNMLKNSGEIALQGVGSNIIVGKDVMNTGSIKSEDSLFWRRVKKYGAFFVDETSTIILQSISFPGLLVKDCIHFDGVGKFNTGIYANSLMIGESGSLELYGGLLLKNNLHNKGNIKLNYNSILVNFIAGEIRLLEGYENKQLLTIQYADGVTPYTGVGIAIFTQKKTTLDEVMKRNVTETTYRIISMTKSMGVDLGGGNLVIFHNNVLLLCVLKENK